MLGRAEKRKRLADLVFNMADHQDKMAEHEHKKKERAFDLAIRPVHVAFLNKRVPCPHVFCKGKFLFYKEDGLDHHYRTIHRIPVEAKYIHGGKSLLRCLHGEETLKCLQEFSDLRSRQVF